MADPFGMLAACCVPVDDTQAAAAVRRAAAEGHDWPRVLRLARSHGLVPLLCHRVLDLAPDLVDRAGREQLRAEAQAAAARALAATRQLLGILDALDSAGVASLPYKGPALALDAYGDAALRDSDDLDLIVAPAAAQPAAAALLAAGYSPVGAASWREARAVYDWQGHVPLRGREDTLPVELHWRFCNRKLPWSPDVGAVMARSSFTQLAGRRIRIPERHDQLVLVLLHAARHGWDRLDGIACAAALARRGVDGGTLRARARAVGGVRACRTGLELVRRITGVAPPAGFDLPALDAAARSRLADRAEARLRQGDAGDARDAGLHIVSLDDAGARVTYIALHLFLPTPRDRALVRLPRALSLLYVPLRAVRLAGRRLTR